LNCYERSFSQLLVGLLATRIKTWTGLPVEYSIRVTEDRDKWRKYVHGVANPRIENGQRTEQDQDTAAELLVV